MSNSKQTILIIEDTVTYQQSLKREFAKRGYDIICVATGEEGLEQVEKSNPALIISNLLLSGINGRDVCRILRMHDEHRFIPMMMLTQQKEDKAIIGDIEAEADSYITKNESMEMIVRRAEALLKLSLITKKMFQREGENLGEEEINLKEKKILIVDDDITYLQGFKRQLTEEGYNVSTGMSGEECFMSLQKDAPDLLLLDLMMPEIDGVDVCRQIRKIRKFHDLPIVMLTPSDSKEDVIRSFEAGVNDYIVKTEDPRVTKSRIYSVLRRRHFEKVSKELNEKMVRQEKLAAMGQLTSTVAHELRGPLGVIRNSAYFLKMRLAKNADEKIEKHLGILEEEVIVADKIIEGALDFVRVKEPDSQYIDIPTLIKDAIEREVIPGNVEIVIKPEEQLPFVQVDILQIRRVFSNLIMNAIQAMPSGGTLTISFGIIRIMDSESRGAEFVEVNFKDTGIGIPEENEKKIFEPLFTTKSKGTGLGLSICQNIIRAHKGMLDLESRQGEGAKFIVRLPVGKL